MLFSSARQGYSRMTIPSAQAREQLAGIFHACSVMQALATHAVACTQSRHAWQKRTGLNAASAHLALSCPCTPYSGPSQMHQQRQRLRTTLLAIYGKYEVGCVTLPPALRCTCMQAYFAASHCRPRVGRNVVTQHCPSFRSLNEKVTP